MTVSLCMIVKNEERVLGRCLDGMRDLVDEIVIVDTGSTDTTKTVAARYTDKIFDFPWINDFSAARNFAFSKGTCDWLMWMDADDVIEDADAFRAMKASLSEDADVVYMPYHTAFDESGNPVYIFERERLVRRTVSHRWQGRVHEVLTHNGRIVHTAVPVIHRSEKTSYSDRNLRIYETQLAEGDPFSPRDLFYYGRELFYHKQFRNAILILTRFLNEKRGWKENCIEACHILSLAYEGEENRLEALTALFRSFIYDTPRAEICCEIGRHFMEQQDWNNAVYWHELALTCTRNDTSGAFVHTDSYGYLPAIRLCVCYDRMHDYERAEAYNTLAGSYRPNATAYLQNLDYFANRRTES